MQAKLVIVMGLPCSGKSTLARKIAARFGFPLMAKDVVKEALFDTLGTGDREWSRRLSTASCAVLLAFAERTIGSGSSAIIEGNFRPEHAEDLARVRNAHGAGLVQVLCGGNGAVLIERQEARVRRRSRHPGHLDGETLHELRGLLRRGFTEALPLDCPTVRFDSTASGAARLDTIFQAIEDLGSANHPAPSQHPGSAQNPGTR